MKKTESIKGPSKVLYATAFYAVGDQFYDENMVVHTVTDVLLCHYVRRGLFKVLYEIDNNGEFVELETSDLKELEKKKQPNILTPRNKFSN